MTIARPSVVTLSHGAWGDGAEVCRGVPGIRGMTEAALAKLERAG